MHLYTIVQGYSIIFIAINEVYLKDLHMISIVWQFSNKNKLNSYIL